MADTREIVITIKGSGETTTQTDKPDNPNPKDSSNIKKSTSILLNQTYQRLKSEISSEVNYEIDKHFRLSDNYIGQRNFNNAKQVINKAVSFGTSIATGFAIGGPVGAVGAFVVQTISLGIDIYQNYDQENINLRQMEAQLSYTRERAGYSLTSGSIGENK